MPMKKQYPESGKNFIQRMLKTLTGTYQNFRPSDNPDQSRAYTEALERMVEEFGQGRTAAAVAKACDLVPDFVPTPAKIREFMPAKQGQMITCTACHPSGFIMVYQGRTDGGNKIDPKYGAVKRCDHSTGKLPVVEIQEGRQYGVADVKYLSHIHAKSRRLNGNQPLSQKQLDGLLDELDAAITKQESGSPDEIAYAQAWNRKERAKIGAKR